MKKESLIKAKEIIIDTLDKSNINQIDKTELMTNLYILLSSQEEYNNGIKALQKSLNNRRK